jgi:hypothetical protein
MEELRHSPSLTIFITDIPIPLHHMTADCSFRSSVVDIRICARDPLDGDAADTQRAHPEVRASAAL